MNTSSSNASISDSTRSKSPAIPFFVAFLLARMCLKNNSITSCRNVPMMRASMFFNFIRFTHFGDVSEINCNRHSRAFKADGDTFEIYVPSLSLFNDSSISASFQITIGLIASGWIGLCTCRFGLIPLSYKSCQIPAHLALSGADQFPSYKTGTHFPPVASRDKTDGIKSNPDAQRLAADMPCEYCQGMYEPLPLPDGSDPSFNENENVLEIEVTCFQNTHHL